MNECQNWMTSSVKHIVSVTLIPHTLPFSAEQKPLRCILRQEQRLISLSLVLNATAEPYHHCNGWNVESFDAKHLLIAVITALLVIGVKRVTRNLFLPFVNSLIYLSATVCANELDLRNHGWGPFVPKSKDGPARRHVLHRWECGRLGSLHHSERHT